MEQDSLDPIIAEIRRVYTNVDHWNAARIHIAFDMIEAVNQECDIPKMQETVLRALNGEFDELIRQTPTFSVGPEVKRPA